MKRIISGVILFFLLAGCLAGCRAEDASVSQNLESSDNTEAAETVVEQQYTPQLPTAEETAEIYVEPVEGIPDDFIRGMDISSLLAEEASGVKYYAGAGNDAAELDEPQDLLKLLADAGINCVRIRVWNDPYDADGHGYGGGNCTAQTAAEIGARAAAYGMATCVDFHYSDFWADPNKQMCPKAWEGMNIDDKSRALYDYTVESLKTILDAGADVTMVQIGNETNHGMAGEAKVKEMTTLMRSGSEAVRAVADEYGRDIRVAVHFTTVDDPDEIRNLAYKLASNKVDYDVFGVSYYPYWHGTLTNMVNVLKNISESYGKETCIMETAYMYTSEDGDGAGNSVSGPDALEDYPSGVQGQANSIRDVCASAYEAGALGVFYWEGAWIPVPAGEGKRSDKWEEYGSGWATSYAGSYDPDDAGRYYGGCSWENQALFDFEGRALPSLDVFKYLKYGATGTANEIIRVRDITIKAAPGDELNLPDTVSCLWSDPSCTDEMSVKWDEDEIASIDMQVTGVYTIHGSVELSGTGVSPELAAANPFNDNGTLSVEASVTVSNENLLSDPSFEDADHSVWSVTASGADPTDYQNKSADAHSGDWAFHFWSKSDMEFSVEQDVTVDKAGKYRAESWMQGGDFNPDAEVYMYVKVNGDEMARSDNVSLDGWVNWKNPQIEGIEASAGDTITVGAYVKCDAEAWATFDDFSLNLQ